MGTPNFRSHGVGYTDLAEDVLIWHRSAFPTSAAHALAMGQAPQAGHNGHGNGNLAAAAAVADVKLDSYGFYKSRRGGEYHAFNPEVVRALHEMVGLAQGKAQKIEPQDTPGASAIYRRFSDLVETRPAPAPRDLLRIVSPGRQAIRLD